MGFGSDIQTKVKCSSEINAESLHHEAVDPVVVRFCKSESRYYYESDF